MRIALCDDEIVILRQISELLGRIAGEYFGKVEIACHSDGNTLLAAQEEDGYDIVILDIQMKPLDGFQIAERLSREKKQFKLIFLSSREELVFQSFFYEPVYFVRKGTLDRMEEEFRRSFRRIREKLNGEIYLSLVSPEDDMLEKVFLKDIESIQSSRNYLLYYTVDGRVYRLRRTMEEEERELSRHGFIRIHRAYLINESHVIQIKRNLREVQLRSGSMLEIGRSYREQMSQRFLQRGI